MIRIKQYEGAIGIIMGALITINVYLIYNFYSRKATGCTAISGYSLILQGILLMLWGFCVCVQYRKWLTRNGGYVEYLTKVAKRILPALFFSNIICILLLPTINRFQLIEVETYQNIGQIFLHLTGMQTGWLGNTSIVETTNILSILFQSLSVYYLICFLSRQTPKIYYLLILATVVTGICVEKASLVIPFLYEENAHGYICFFSGVILAEIYVKTSNLSRKGLKMMSILILCCLSLVITSDSSIALVNPIGTAICVGCLLILIITTDGPIELLLRNKFLAKWGRCSCFGLSLVYPIVLVALMIGEMTSHATLKYIIYAIFILLWMLLILMEYKFVDRLMKGFEKK